MQRKKILLSGVKVKTRTVFFKYSLRNVKPTLPTQHSTQHRTTKPTQLNRDTNTIEKIK